MTQGLTDTRAWHALKEQADRLAQVHLRDLFAADPQRGERLTCSSSGLLLDYSKNRIDSTTLPLLCDLAKQMKVSVAISRMFAGEKINTTEQQPVLHTAFRDPSRPSLLVNGENIMPGVRENLLKMQQLSESLRQGTLRSATGEKITDIVNIGIGGSDLGPALTVEALANYHHTSVRVHFISNVDGMHIRDTLDALNPENTLLIISSKSFTTPETLLNARTAKLWLGNKPQQLFAVTANLGLATEFGIPQNNIFSIPDWLGGRYSVWSAIALPLVLAIGIENFQTFLQGAKSMDEHFKQTPMRDNMPMIMALLGVWYRNFFSSQNHAVIPYCQRLRRLPDYLMQLDMESNGKQVSQTGQELDYATGPVLWGGVGTNGQHAFHQHLMQSKTMVPLDFILPLKASHSLDEHHELLVANCLSQSETLALGLKKEDRQRRAQHQLLPGNKPSNTVLLKQLTPHTLGALLALYEHKVFVQGVIWNINSFDQYGVEAGKQLTPEVIAALRDEKALSNSSTRHLSRLYQECQQETKADAFSKLKDIT